MKFSGRIVQRIILYTLLAFIVPMVAFPEQFGTQLTRFSVVNLAYELVFYGFVIYLWQRRGTLLQLVQSAAVCLVYRLALGAALGLLISAVYSMSTTISLNLSLFSYRPAVLFHIVAAPFILMQFINQLYGPRRRAVESPEKGAEHVPQTRTTAGAPRLPQQAERPPLVQPAARPPQSAPRFEESVHHGHNEEPTRSQTYDLNGFERAVRYIGEHGSVALAAVVDHEGLMLASFVRGAMQAEYWSPLALVFMQNSEEVLRRGNLEAPEKLDIMLKDKRITVARHGAFSLMVMAERQSDDVLNIRINQGLEMVARYVAERYGDRIKLNAERVNVSGA